MPVFPKNLPGAATGATDRGTHLHPYYRSVRPGEVITYPPNGGLVYCPRPRKIIKHNQWNMELFERHRMPLERDVTISKEEFPVYSFFDESRGDGFQLPAQNLTRNPAIRHIPAPIARDEAVPPYLQPMENVSTHQAPIYVAHTSSSNENGYTPNPLMLGTTNYASCHGIRQIEENSLEFLELYMPEIEYGMDYHRLETDSLSSEFFLLPSSTNSPFSSVSPTRSPAFPIISPLGSGQYRAVPKSPEITKYSATGYSAHGFRPTRISSAGERKHWAATRAEDNGYDGNVEEAYRTEREVLDLEHAMKYYKFVERHKS